MIYFFIEALFHRGIEARFAVEPCALPWLEPTPPWGFPPHMETVTAMHKAPRALSGVKPRRQQAGRTVVTIQLRHHSYPRLGKAGPAPISESLGTRPCMGVGWRMSSGLFTSFQSDAPFPVSNTLFSKITFFNA